MSECIAMIHANYREAFQKYLGQDKSRVNDSQVSSFWSDWVMTHASAKALGASDIFPQGYGYSECSFLASDEH